MRKGMVKAIVLLPITMLIIVPSTILVLQILFSENVSPPAVYSVQLYIAFATLVTGVFLAGWSAKTILDLSGGTLAPWDPPTTLVIDGPYRYVRNPMIIGVVFVLLGEVLLTNSIPLLVWCITFLVANMIYFPLVEEKGLEKRFGDDYCEYKRNVPRWIPRIRGWDPKQR